MSGIEFLGKSHINLKKNWLIITILYMFTNSAFQFIHLITNPTSNFALKTPTISIFFTMLLNGLAFAILYYCVYIKNGYKLLKFNYIAGPISVIFSVIVFCVQEDLSIFGITQVASHAIFYISWAIFARKLISINKMYYKDPSDDVLFSRKAISTRKRWLLSLVAVLSSFTICSASSLCFLDSQLFQDRYHYFFYFSCYLMFSTFVYLMLHHHCYKQLGNKLLIGFGSLLFISSSLMHLAFSFHFKSTPLFVILPLISLWFLWMSVKMFRLNRRHRNNKVLA
ncbi:MAG: hypothetical protein SNF33_00330 (plasmid) [Candidatus Algichlamydia australiensis]|nr:hypothetical protein [Chlamydiales bacterium]